MLTPTLDRLHHAITTHKQAQPESVVPQPARPHRDLPPIEQIFRGEWLQTPRGPVFIKDEWFPLDHAHGAITLGAALNADPTALGHLLGTGEAPHPEQYAFFDIETTGLSGGTGTYIVLAGLGTYERAAPDEPLAFRLRQYFLAGLQHEHAMLDLMATDLGRCEALVTYNGRSFDVPVVESRLTMARVPSPCGDLAHFDLLHAFRRLYKHRSPGCRLADAERKLLRIERADDIPGSLIPQLYRDYVVVGRASPLRGVFRHNADDVLSLAGLLSSLASLLSRDQHEPDDAIAVARWWERIGDESRALKLYRAALPWLEGSDDWPWAASRAARLLRRSGARSEAAVIWAQLWDVGDRAAGLELAKHHEHHTKQACSAREIVSSLLPDAMGEERESLLNRIGRIERKLAITAEAVSVTSKS